MATKKQLNIQTNISQRVLKELLTYEVEVESEAAKTAKMHKRGADSYDIKQQMMVPDCRKRLKDALMKLQDNVARGAKEPNDQGDELLEIKDAQKLIKYVEEKLVMARRGSDKFLTREAKKKPGRPGEGL